MPYVIAQKGDQWCVYKEGDDKQPTGDTLGCHDTEAEAKKQLAALYANVPEAARSMTKMSTIQDLWGKIQALFEPALAEAGATAENVEQPSPDPAETKRAVSIGNVYAQIDEAMYQSGESGMGGPWLMDLYIDKGQMIAIGNQGGKLVRGTVEFDGDTARLNAMEPVEISFTPTMRTSFSITRQTDGRYRWFSLAETNVLNRVGEIDSAGLFKEFVRRFREDPEAQPVLLDFYHEGPLVMGQADWLDTDGHLLLASGLLDDVEQNPLARAFVDASAAGRGQWGCSTSFMPSAEPQLAEIVPGVTIPVYESGVLRRIAVLPEDRAASWFTAIGVEVKREMDAKVKDALYLLFGDDKKAEADKFISSLDETNRAIDEKGLVTRGAESEPDKPAEPAQEAPAPLDEAAVQRIAEAAVAKAPVVDLTPLTEAVTKLAERLDSLEAAEQERQADMPAQPAARPTYRPREQRQAGEQSLSQIAEASLSKLRPDVGQGVNPNA